VGVSEASPNADGSTTGRGAGQSAESILRNIAASRRPVSGSITRLAIVLFTGNGDDDEAGRAQALAAATTGVTTMLTADPADAEGFADRVIGTSAGQRRDQLTAARDSLIDAARGLATPSTGNVIVAGLRSDPTDGDAEGSTAQALLVAEASDPELVGSTAQGDRITLSVRLLRTADGWRITGAVPVKAGS